MKHLSDGFDNLMDRDSFAKGGTGAGCRTKDHTVTKAGG